MCSKAAALDILTADIKRKIDYDGYSYSMVDDDVVLAVTGMNTYKAMKDAEKKTEEKATKAAEAAKETEGEE